MKTKLILFVFTIGIFSCGNHDNHGANSVSNQIKEGEKLYQGVDVSSEKYTEGIKMHEVEFGDKKFFIRERESKMMSFPCSECHTTTVEELKNTNKQQAHWNIKLKHATADVMNCMTCHTDNNMDMLHTGTGFELKYNDSYKLCGQCHSPQYKDWQGGAHGKQVKSWAPPRVSNACTSCHNPHSPGFESRWPTRYNTNKAVEGK